MNLALKIINLLSLVVMLAVNALANLLPLGGNTTGDVSVRYSNLFTPTPITFAIWGVIYLFMAAFVFAQSGIVKSAATSTDFNNAVGIWFIISCLLNISWLFAWHFDQIGLSTFLIFLLLLTLIIVNIRIGRLDNSRVWDRIAAYGFNIYLGWLTAACLANVSVLLKKLGWTNFGMSDEFWTIVVLGTGAAIGVCLALISPRPLATLTIVWAYCGILVKHSTSTGYGGAYPSIITTLLIAIIAMAVSIVAVCLNSIIPSKS